MRRFKQGDISYVEVVWVGVHENSNEPGLSLASSNFDVMREYVSDVGDADEREDIIAVHDVPVGFLEAFVGHARAWSLECKWSSANA